MQIKTFTFNPFAENTYVLYTHEGKAAIVDPGCHNPDEEQQLKTFVDNNNLTVEAVLNTHCHIDHVLGNYFAQQTFKAPLLLHQTELEQLRAVPAYAPSYGVANYQPTEPDGFLEPGTPITIGNQTFEVLFAPGHAPGHIVLYNQAHNFVIAGDVLFAGSIGRTDLPGGDYNTLENSIKTVMYQLPNDCTVYPGHGPTTTIGHEKTTNPFVRG